MKKLKKIVKKVFIILSLIILNLLGFVNSVNAASVSNANVYMVGDCGNLLKYKGVVVKVSYVQYTNEGEDYPAYCLDKTKPGAESGEYSVSVQGAIQDVGLWKRVINGYPYKTPQELGVSNREEAFTATKQAIYCYIHGNNPADYEAIGEAGQRTLNAMHMIINNANNSNESKISSTIFVNKNVDEWKQDKNDKNYLSKEYSVTAGAPIQNYKIQLTKENAQNLGGIKLVDENNIEKSEFFPSEKFKIMIPIKNMTEKGNIKINVEAKISTKPALYGQAPNSGYQDYALTAAIYEDGTGNTEDEYQKNETKIIIYKQDEATEEKLEGVEFELLNEKEEIVYSNLKTDKDGKIVIENIIPGRYYLKEVNTKEGYEKYEDLIEIQTILNEETTVIINNSKEEKPKVETKTSQKQVTVRKLPVTGM